MVVGTDPTSANPAGNENQPLITNEDAVDGEVPESIWEDARDTIGLAVPIFLSMASWVGMKTTDSALLGHVSADALSAASLSDLWTMCTGVFIQGRVLGILCGSAIGAGNPKLAGIYLQVSYYVLSFLCVFVIVAWYMTGYVWLAFGSDPKIAHMAGYYAQVLAWSIPGQMAFSQLQQFFSSQRIMHPEVNASMVAVVLNLAFGLVFVLGIPIPGWSGFGFAACPWVTASVIYIQLLVIYVVYIHIQKLHLPCWGGWDRREISWARIQTFSDLYFPSAFGVASDFWRVAVIGALAAKLGELQVAVFNTSYRIMWIVMIMVSALSSASGIKTSLRLGKLDHKGAKQASEVGTYMCAVFLLITGGLVAWKVRWLGRIFTNDPAFLDACEEVRWPFAITLVLMNMAVAIERIPYSMGRTKEVFWYGFFASWGAQVPAVYLFTRYWKNDLIRLYWGMAFGYFVLVVLYGWMSFTSDWKKHAEMARQRSEMSDDKKTSNDNA